MPWNFKPVYSSAMQAAGNLLNLLDCSACSPAAERAQLSPNAMQVSMNNFATSYWFKQRRGTNGLVVDVAEAVELPHPDVPIEATFPFIKPANLRFS